MINSSFNRLVCYLALAIAFTAQAWAAREKIEGVVAVVNSEVVLESDLKKFENRLNKEGLIDELLIVEGGLAGLKASKKSQLEYLVSEKIMDSEVKRLNLSVTMDRVEQEMKEIAKRNGMARNDLVSALSQQGIGLAEYQNFMKTRIERQSLLEQEITSKIRVSDEEVLNMYVRNSPQKNSSASEFTLAHIFFNPAKTGGAESAMKRAKEVLAKLNSGSVFETLAEQHSEDPSFTQGGVLGTFKSGESIKEFEEAVGYLEPGQTSGIIKSKNGFHLLKLVSRKSVVDPNFEKVREKIRSELMEKAFQKQFRSWLEQKREDSFVRINS